MAPKQSSCQHHLASHKCKWVGLQVQQHFRPEFVNRVDEFIVFQVAALGFCCLPWCTCSSAPSFTCDRKRSLLSLLSVQHAFCYRGWTPDRFAPSWRCKCALSSRPPLAAAFITLAVHWSAYQDASWHCRQGSAQVPFVLPF